MLFQFMRPLILIWALFSVGFALQFETYPSSVVAGQTYAITYSPKDNTPTTFILRKGSSSNLFTVATLTTTVTGGSFAWIIPDGLPDGSDYILEILQGSTINYSAQFRISGGSGVVQSSLVVATQIPTQPAVATSQLAPVSTQVTPTPTPAVRVTVSSVVIGASSAVAGQSGGASSPFATDRSDSSASASRLDGSSTATTSAGQSSTSGAAAGGATSGGGGGLSTGAKVGIGVGVTIAILGFGFGAFFLGMSVRKKSKAAHDGELGPDNDKPELEGKSAYRHEIILEMDAGTVPVQERQPGLEVAPVAAPVVGTKELEANLHQPIQPVQPVSLVEAELQAQPIPHEMESKPIQPPAHELQGSVAHAGSQELQAADAPQSDLARRDTTYDDPQLTQNPWAQDDAPPRK